MQELADRLCLRISTVTRAVDGLVKKRRARRRKDTDDKRVVRVEMTEPGRKIHRKIYEDFLSREEELLTSLGEDVREQVVDASKTLLHGIAPGRVAGPALCQFVP
jgi:DNA-binding MarR family transcriptional regulator